MADQRAKGEIDELRGNSVDLLTRSTFLEQRDTGALERSPVSKKKR